MTSIHNSSPTARRYLPGDGPKYWRPGDIILTHNPDNIVSSTIRFGQRLWYWGDNAKYTWFNHVAIVTKADPPRLVEALGGGIQETDALAYEPQWFAYVDTGMDLSARQHVVAYANRMAALRAGYGWLQILSLAIALLTRGRLQFSMTGQNICSGLAGEALRGGGVWFERDGKMASSSFLMPADLAASFHTEDIQNKVLDKPD